MKIRHSIIISVVLFIGLTILGDEYLPIDFRLNKMLITILLPLWFISLGLIAYLIIRSIFRAIKGTVTGVPQNGGYRGEAQRACKKVTPKKTKQAQDNLPWEG